MAKYGEREKRSRWEVMKLMKQVFSEEIQGQAKRYTHVQCLHLCNFSM